MSHASDPLERRFAEAKSAGMTDVDERALRLCLRKINEDHDHINSLLLAGDMVRVENGLLLRPRNSSGEFTDWGLILVKHSQSDAFEVKALIEQRYIPNKKVREHGAMEQQGNVIPFHRGLAYNVVRVGQEVPSEKEFGTFAATRGIDVTIRESIKWRHPADSRRG